MKRRSQSRSRAAAALICLAEAALVSCAVVQPGAAQAPMITPSVEKEAPPRACSGCHGLGVLAHMRQGEEGWRAIVDYMVLHGAYMTPAEYEGAVGWLVRNYGLTAPQEQPANVGPQDRELVLVIEKCTSCHSLERVTQQARTPAAWGNIVAQMRAIGARMSNSEAVQIVRYLGKNHELAKRRN
jgi:hypothetical protein